jgi:hypothetical protein
MSVHQMSVGQMIFDQKTGIPLFEDQSEVVPSFIGGKLSIKYEYNIYHVLS